MYAIVDIETTGGHAAANGITEIAIVLYDGKEITHRYHTLINPGRDIPVYIRALTGISNEMVQQAPRFREVAKEVFSLISDRIFVAHNVNFDYSFLKYHLSQEGFDLQCKKLCTVRLGRKIFPGFSSYSLGKLCVSLGIKNTDRHRALGDAEATACLFAMLLQNDKDDCIRQSLKRGSREQQIPPNLAATDIDKLPMAPGVYYFYDSKGKAVYVGKAVNLKKRVCSHFTGNNAGKQRQDFLKNIHSVSYSVCGTELMAFILEAIEIKRLWPQNNRAMKRFEQAYGLFSYEDQRGYLRMVIDKKRKHSAPLYSFNGLINGHNMLVELVSRFKLCPKLCMIQKNQEECRGMEQSHCYGACQGAEPAQQYNMRVQEAIAYLKRTLPSFAIVDKGRTEQERSVVLMEEGRVHGMGYIAADCNITDMSVVKTLVQPQPSNDYIRNLVLDHAARYPHKVMYTASTG